MIQEFVDYLKRIYGKLAVIIGEELDYLGMHFRFVGDKVQVVMKDFILDIITDFPELIDITAEDPAGQKLFEVRNPSEKNPLLGTELAQSFHWTTAKLLYLCAKARQEIRTPVAFLTTRVRAPDTDDWERLRRVLRYLYCNPGLPLTLKTDNLEVMDCTWTPPLQCTQI